MSHIYRAAEVHVLCARCRQPAVFCCPGCGTATCQDHTDFVELCPSCALELNAAERRAGRLGTWLIAGVGAAGTVALLATTAIAAPAAAIAGLIAALTYRGLRQAQQRKAFRRRSEMFVLEGARLQIARNVQEDDWRDQRRPTSERADVPYFPVALC